LLQAARTAVDSRQIFMEFSFYFDVRGVELMFEQGQGVADDFVDVTSPTPRRSCARS